jgi:hypothetical protein
MTYILILALIKYMNNYKQDMVDNKKMNNINPAFEELTV